MNRENVYTLYMEKDALTHTLGKHDSAATVSLSRVRQARCGKDHETKH